MRLVAALSVGLLLFGGVLSDAGAQATDRRGLVLGAGAGRGLARLACGICQAERQGGLTGYVQAGVMAGGSVLLGLEGAGWLRDEAGVNQRIWTLTGTASVYPRAVAGLYFKGGLGMLSYRARDDADQFRSRALTAIVGMGYELRVGRSLTVAPFAALFATANADLDFNGSRVAGDASFTLLQLGLGLTLD